jgi:hypothetical protein
MSLPNKKTFVFDLDQTILSARIRRNLLNGTEISDASFDPYFGLGNGTDVINRSSISSIFKDILNNKDEIAFITAGNISRDVIRRFCSEVLNIELPESFQHFNQTQNKTPALHEIKANRIPSDIVFVDNSMSHITPAKEEGFRTIYADNNRSDKTNGTKYISELKQFIQERKHEIAQARDNAARTIQKHVRSLEGKTAFLKARETREAREAREARENILLRIPENEKEGFKRKFEGKTLEELKSLDNFSGGIVNRFNESLAPETAQINEICQTAAKNYRAELTFHALNYKLDEGKDNNTSKNKFIAAAKKSEKEAISAFDKDIPVSQVKQVCVNILSHVFTLGVANLINKAATGNYLFYKHSQETNNLRKTKEIRRELS